MCIMAGPVDCRMYENKYPDVDDVVMVQVKSIAEMGAYVSLLEYNGIEGMILLSELSRRRIRSITKLIKVRTASVHLCLVQFIQMTVFKFTSFILYDAFSITLIWGCGRCGFCVVSIERWRLWFSDLTKRLYIPIQVAESCSRESEELMW